MAGEYEPVGITGFSGDDQDEKKLHEQKGEVQKKELGETVVSVYDLTKSFKLHGREELVHALNGVELNDKESSDFGPIRRGEFVMIRGPSGGGKTTFLNMLGSIDHPTSGMVELFGETIDKSSKDSFLADLRLRKIGFVFQTFNLLATMSAFENVELPMVIMGKLTRKECKARAIELLDMVGLQDRYGHLPSELSGGEQQRVTIARALSNEPDVLLLDEPTGDLDTRNTIDIMDLLLEVNQEKGTTCIMVTHNPDLECYADRILYVQDGKFQKEAVNVKQQKIDFELYMNYIHEKDKARNS